MELLHKEITDKIIKAYFNVYNELSFGFLEKVYERSMLIELKSNGLNCSSQQKIDVFYRKYNVGDYFADIIVEDKIIIELKNNKRTRSTIIELLESYINRSRFNFKFWKSTEV